MLNMTTLELTQSKKNKHWLRLERMMEMQVGNGSISLIYNIPMR